MILHLNNQNDLDSPENIYSKEVNTFEARFAITAFIGAILSFLAFFWVTPIAYNIYSWRQPSIYELFEILIFLESLVLVIATYFSSSWLISRTLVSIYNPKISQKIKEVITKNSNNLNLTKQPILLFVEKEEPDCFVFGRTTSKTKLVLTSGLLSILSERELDSVILHELCHIRNRDVAIMTWGSAFIRSIKYWLVLILSTRILQLVISLWTGSQINFSNLLWNLIFFNILLLVLMPLISISYFSRSMDLIADAQTVISFGRTDYLISAIKKIRMRNLFQALKSSGKKNFFHILVDKILLKLPKGYLFKKYLTAIRPSKKERLLALKNRRFIVEKGNLITPSMESSIHAGFLGIYCVLGGSVIFFAPIAIIGEALIANITLVLQSIIIIVGFGVFYLGPIFSITLINIYAIKKSDVSPLLNNTKEYLHYIKRLFLSTAIAISSFLTLFFIYSINTMLPQEGPIRTIMFYLVAFWIYSLLSILITILYLNRKIGKIKKSRAHFQ